MVEIGMPTKPWSQQTMRARLILARNISAILTARSQSQTALAVWCHKQVSWINKILSGQRPMHIDDFDRVADFLGISVYQLFQPGISGLTERRKPGDRRTGRDRRIGHKDRIVALRNTTLGGEHGASEAATAAIVSARAELDALVTDFARRADALLARTDSGGQTPRTRSQKSSTRHPRQPPRRPDAVDGDVDKHK